MAERTPKVAENPWRWFRQDPALARAMQTVLLTGEGGDIIAAMRAMDPAAVLDAVGASFGDLCEEATRAYHTARQRADQWGFWQLVLGVTTVVVIVVSMTLTLVGLVQAGVSAGAISLVTSSGVLWFDKKVEENRKEAEARFRDMARYCTHNRLILQLSKALDGLEPEQQERLVHAILSLRM